MVYIISLIFLLSPSFSYGTTLKFHNFLKVVKANKKIEIPGFPKAHNPSMIRTKEGILLVFRITPDPENLWISYIGLVLLNEEFEVISEPTMLSTRNSGYSEVGSQSEDARILRAGGKLYLVYNDNIEVERPTISGRRDMFVAELKYEEGSYYLDIPIKMCHPVQYELRKWEKNWVPFEWDRHLMFAYMINPHEILSPDLSSGVCTPQEETGFPASLWKFGAIKGGTPALNVDGEYLAFFHSSVKAKSFVTGGKQLWHYLMGAYTFSADPPFAITHITPFPILGKDFYTASDCDKRVIFPGGFIISGDEIHIAMGKDDAEVWICTIDKAALKKSFLKIR